MMGRPPAWCLVVLGVCWPFAIASLMLLQAINHMQLVSPAEVAILGATPLLGIGIVAYWVWQQVGSHHPRGERVLLTLLGAGLLVALQALIGYGFYALTVYLCRGM